MEVIALCLTGTNKNQKLIIKCHFLKINANKDAY
jgi:hypothetical protein